MYLIQNPVNDKRYVGKTTKTVKERFEGHARCKKTPIGKAIHKYGKKKFRYGIIKTCATKKEYPGLSGSTITSKIAGKHKFFPAEMAAIKKFLNTELSIEELFKRNDTN